MSAVASFVGKIFLNGIDVTHSPLLNQIREKKATGSKPTKRQKTSQTRYKRYTSPDDDDDDPKPTWKKTSATSQKRAKWDNQSRAQWNSQNLNRRATTQDGQTRKRGKWNAVSRKRKATSPQKLEWESLDGKRSKIKDVNDWM